MEGFTHEESRELERLISLAAGKQACFMQEMQML